MFVDRDDPTLISYHHLQALRPYSPSELSKRLQLRFTVLRRRSQIDFLFSLTGDTPSDLATLVLPALRSESERARRDELWKSTCLEIFVGAAEASSYLEMNLSPSGDWNLYSFDSYRAGMRPAVSATGPLVGVERSQSGDTLTWKGALRLAYEGEANGEGDGELKTLLEARALVMGATAVLEYGSGEREYWALAHVGDKPDFHLRDSFRLKL